MYAVEGDAGSSQTSCQLVREKNIADLRRSVRGKLTVASLALQVVQEVRRRRYAGCQIDNPPRRGLPDEVQHQIRQQKWCEMAEGKSPFYAVSRVFLSCESSADIVHENVDSGLLRMKSCR